ncbi:MAG: polysaccharide biosynthesis/export family protein [Verrucomicrobiota bacterium]
MLLRHWIRFFVVAAALLPFSTMAQEATKPIADNPASRPRAVNALPGTGALYPAIFANMELLNDSVKLGKGDRINFRVLEDEEDPKSLVVTDAGEIEVPYSGLVQAADKSCRQLAREIKELLQKDLYYQATVIISIDTVSKTRLIGKVYVTGDVKMPITLDLIDGETNTVTSVLLKAGGLGAWGDQKKVQLVRRDASGGKRTIILDVEKIWQKGATDQDIVLQAEDHIFVPTRVIRF